MDHSQVEYLFGRLLNAEPHEVAVIRDALLPYKKRLIERLWTVLEQPEKGRESQPLRAACALATYDPNASHWDQAGSLVVEQLVSVNPLFLVPWMEGIRAVKAKLLAPLSVVFRDRSEGRTYERRLATSILAHFASDQADLLTDLIQDADERQYTVLFPTLEPYRDRAAAVISETATASLESKVTDEERERLAQRQANAGVVLLKMGQAEKVWPLLRHRPDPRARSYLIHRLSLLGADPRAIIKRFGEERDVSIRRALLLVLGEYGEKGVVPTERQRLVPRLLNLYRDDLDPGIHGSLAWLLRQWNQGETIDEIDLGWAQDKQWREQRVQGIRQELAKGEGRLQSQWYVNGQGQTMVVISGPVEFLMGSPSTESGRCADETQHRKRINRTFGIAAKAVTVKQYLAFHKLKFGKEYDYDKERAPTDDCPMHGTSWYMAAEYCNWLTDQEGIPKEEWCYEMDRKGEITKLRESYLSLTGYRLPTEAEWEYACRAGAVTSRYYGETEELLGKYAWYVNNAKDRCWPVGNKKPNDFGLFDMHGNVYTWCQERYGPFPTAENNVAGEDKEDEVDIRDKDGRVLRGGSFNDQSRFVRSALRIWDVPSNPYIYVGLRPARTFR